MDIFNPPETQHIIPPPPSPQQQQQQQQPRATSSAVSNSTTYNTNNNNNITSNYSSAKDDSFIVNSTNGISSTSSHNNNNNSNSNNNNNVTVTIDTKQMQNELERRQQELEIKAAELEAREEALRQGGEFRRQHNWPPLPSFCPIKPCFFQDINVDIKPEFQRTVQLGYHMWIALVFTEMLNLLGSIVLVAYGSSEASSYLQFAILTLIIIPPLSYVSWFRPLYKAFRSDSSFNFMIFFFVFFMQTLVVSLWALGLNGPCGLFVALGSMKDGIILTFILFIVAAAWIALAIASVLYLLKVHAIYRSTGASLARARNEFTQGVISNRYVQQTVASAARQTVSQTFSGTQATGDNQQSLPR